MKKNIIIFYNNIFIFIIIMNYKINYKYLFYLI